MAIEILDVAPVVNEALARQHEVYQAARASGTLVVPRLVGLADNHAPAILSYSKAIDGHVAQIDPAHQRNQTADDATYRLFTGNPWELRQEIDRLKGVPGLGMLLFKPLADPEAARKAGVLQAIPHEQDVDSQQSSLTHDAATAQFCFRVAAHELKARGHSFKGKHVGIYGRGEAVGGPLARMLATAKDGQRPDAITVITHETNQEWLAKAALFDVFFLAAGGDTAESITRDMLRRSDISRPLPQIVIDAAYGIAPDGSPRGNLHRDLTDPTCAGAADLNVVVTPFGAVGRGTRTEIINNTFNVLSAQESNLFVAAR